MEPQPTKARRSTPPTLTPSPPAQLLLLLPPLLLLLIMVVVFVLLSKEGDDFEGRATTSCRCIFRALNRRSWRPVRAIAAGSEPASPRQTEARPAGGRPALAAGPAIFLTEAGEKFHFLLLRQLNPPNCSSDLQTCALLLKC
jgi:hypothetical protein